MITGKQRPDVGVSSCITCRRSVSRHVACSLSKALPEPDYCGFCCRARSEAACAIEALVAKKVVSLSAYDEKRARRETTRPDHRRRGSRVDPARPLREWRAARLERKLAETTARVAALGWGA